MVQAEQYIPTAIQPFVMEKNVYNHIAWNKPGVDSSSKEAHERHLKIMYSLWLTHLGRLQDNYESTQGIYSDSHSDKRPIIGPLDRWQSFFDPRTFTIKEEVKDEAKAFVLGEVGEKRNFSRVFTGTFSDRTIVPKFDRKFTLAIKEIFGPLGIDFKIKDFRIQWEKDPTKHNENISLLWSIFHEEYPEFAKKFLNSQTGLIKEEMKDEVKFFITSSIGVQIRFIELFTASVLDKSSYPLFEGSYIPVISQMLESVGYDRAETEKYLRDHTTDNRKNALSSSEAAKRDYDARKGRRPTEVAIGNMRTAALKREQKKRENRLATQTSPEPHTVTLSPHMELFRYFRKTHMMREEDMIAYLDEVRSDGKIEGEMMAELYERYWNTGYAGHTMRAALQTLNDIQEETGYVAKTMVDIGSGPLIARRMIQEGSGIKPRVISVDLSAAMLTFGKEILEKKGSMVPESDIVHASMTETTLPESSADTVISSLAFHYGLTAEGRGNTIREANRVLTVGGSYLITIPHTYLDPERFTQLAREMEKCGFSVRAAHSGLAKATDHTESPFSVWIVALTKTKEAPHDVSFDPEFKFLFEEEKEKKERSGVETEVRISDRSLTHEAFKLETFVEHVLPLPDIPPFGIIFEEEKPLFPYVDIDLDSDDDPDIQKIDETMTPALISERLREGWRLEQEWASGEYVLVAPQQ